MPLTIAHAAAAWPISRRARRLPLAALVIGTMAPDFAYLVHLQPRGHYGHGLAGLFVLCVPTSLGAWIVFEWLVKPALVQLLPSGVRSIACQPACRSGPLRYAWAAMAALVGALTHIAWDGFTHERGLAEAGIAALRAPVAPAALGNLRWYQLLQHASTVVGLAVLLLWAWTTWRRFPRQARRFMPDEAARAWRVLLLLGGTAAMAAVLNGMRASGYGTRIVLGFAAVGAMDALILATLGYAIAMRFANRRRSPICPPTVPRTSSAGQPEPDARTSE